jgi:dihydropteroate synthase
MMTTINLKNPKTLVMGILNRTPDSFSDGGSYLDLTLAVERALQIESQGADILDIGGESTRPGSASVSEEEEVKRVIPLIERLQGKLQIPISVDTTKSKVARLAIETGASLINDISAFHFDPELLNVAAQCDVPLVIMHMQGEPRTMQTQPVYKDVVREVTDFLKMTATQALSQGIKPENIILDPGIGFGKTIEHNLSLLSHLDVIVELGYPVLIGLSRKSFIGKLWNLQIEERLYPGLAANIIAAWKGAKIIRTHDVKETVQALRMADIIKSRGVVDC